MRCSQKDRLAGDELYRRYAVSVYTLCKRYLGNEEDAKDMMLDTLVQALDKMDSFVYKGEGSLGRWIRKMAINKSIDRLRKHHWWIVPLDGWIKDTLPDPGEEEMEMIPKEKLQEWIAGLPRLRRAVFNLYCLDGYSHQEIGRMLGISERGSTSTLAKARKELKEKIKQYLKQQDR